MIGLSEGAFRRRLNEWIRIAGTGFSGEGRPAAAEIKGETAGTKHGNFSMKTKRSTELLKQVVEARGRRV